MSDDEPWFRDGEGYGHNGRIRRLRDLGFVDAVRKYGVPKTAEQRRLVAVEAWPSMESYSQASIDKKVEQKLRQPDIRAAIRDLYEEAAGFTQERALQLQVKMAESGNWPALKHYLDNTMQQPAKQVQVESRNLNVHVDAGSAGAVLRDGPPPTRSRVVGSEPLGYHPTKQVFQASEDE